MFVSGCNGIFFQVTPMLIRVKTTEDADELLEILNKKKQECE